VANLGDNRPHFLRAPHLTPSALFNWINKCGNFPTCAFSPKYGLIAAVGRNKPSRSRLSPVRIRTKLAAKISPSSLKERADGWRTGSSANTSMIISGSLSS
jgi:hypothetical protein